MSGCHELEQYRDRELSFEERFAFETHLTECARCRESTTRWGEIESEIVSVTVKAEKRLPVWSEKKKERLIREATAKRHKRSMLWLRPAAIAAAAAILVGLAVFFTNIDSKDEKHEENAPLEITARLVNGKSVYPMVLSDGARQTIESPKWSRVLLNIGKDIVGLAYDSRLKIVELSATRTRLILEHGTVVCSVAHEASEREFFVETGQLVVRVTGTHFAVSRSDDGGAHVDVSEGRVRVEKPGQEPRSVSAGHRLRVTSDGQATLTPLTNTAEEKMALLLSDQPSSIRDSGSTGHDVGYENAPQIEKAEIVEHLATKQEDETAAELISEEVSSSGSKRRSKAARTGSLSKWRDWIVHGRLDEAERAIVAHLQKSGKDKAAWSLLADCRRKAGDYRGAIGAYRKVIALAPTTEANKARFRAGKILQDRLGAHGEAIKLFEDYVDSKSSSKVLKAEALLRMARSHRSMGRITRARVLLKEVAKGHSGTAAAEQARRILKELETN
ncbi:MAG: tetratricopeptide repeat protein [Deltaproteobacteria bacterium]|nr:tetratricopeptide repeat protein [Deltaproteobacteria bacterium]